MQLSHNMKNRWFYPFLALLLGLFTAQAISTAQVYLSNLELYRTLVIVKEAGYLPIPNERTMPHLQRFAPAFFGGLFFTLTVGTGLSLISLAAAWTWDRLFERERIIIIPYVLLWLGSLVAVNYRGLSPMVTLYFILIPLVVFGSASKWIPPDERKDSLFIRSIHVTPLLLLALLWTFQANTLLYTNLRDSLLLSNPVGIKINDFYYDYTLYPAEVFKTLNQKTIKSSSFENLQDDTLAEVLENHLNKQGYLTVDRDRVVDLTIVKQENELIFKNRGKAILRATQADFLSDSGAILEEFSRKSDRHAFFRQNITPWSLKIGFPTALYIFLYTLLRLLFSVFSNTRMSSIGASSLCFAAGTGLLVIFSLGGVRAAEEDDLKKAIQSERLGDRIAALKTIEQKELEVSEFQVYSDLLKSPHIVERYWLARALSFSKRPDTLNDLMTLMDDPHRNVINMALYALGRRGEKRTIHDILKRMKTSTDWYTQWYAYEALRNLGWKQSKSR
jgi:hypothetical protein